MAGVRFMVSALVVGMAGACGGSTNDGNEQPHGGSSATPTGGDSAIPTGRDGAAGDAGATGGTSTVGTSAGGPAGDPGGGTTAGTAGETGEAGGTGGETPSPEACTGPMEVGNCEAAMPRYWHDPDTGVCLRFTYGGCGGNENNHETLDACNAACAGYPDELDACVAWGDCALVSSECCGGCEPVTTNALVAVHVDNADTYQELRGCNEVMCGGCADVPISERTRHNFYAACVQGQCTVRDVREQPFTECSVAADCRLRCGAGCCASCGQGEDVIALRTDTDSLAELCGGVSTGCDPCICTLPETLAADCVGGRCVVGRSLCTPGRDQTCNASPLMSALAGVCNDDGTTCTCNAGYTQDPDSGLCY